MASGSARCRRQSKAFDLSRYGAPPDQLTDKIDPNLYEVAQVVDSGQWACRPRDLSRRVETADMS
jgi:hypothetical protein